MAPLGRRHIDAAVECRRHFQLLDDTSEPARRPWYDAGSDSLLQLISSMVQCTVGNGSMGRVFWIGSYTFPIALGGNIGSHLSSRIDRDNDLSELYD